jgi:serine/threonine protein kinase
VFASKRFEVLSPLGEGGMGIVYEAIDRERGGRVALKTLRNATAEHLGRLKREFRAMQDVQHPSLVSLRELVCEGDTWFLTMDLVDGVDFIRHVRAAAHADLAGPPASSRVRDVESSDPTLPLGRPRTEELIIPVARARTDDPVFDEARLRAAMRQLAEGLLALHAAGMVHRDVKPSNVLVTRDGRVVILDFGLVADAREGATTLLAAAGTPAYMAPEQAASGEVGPAADWYAVGVLLYEALTGRVPFSGPSLEVLIRKQSEVPIPPSALGAGVPPDLDALCVALLRFKPSERLSGGALLRRLGGVPRSDDASASGSRTLTPAFVGRAGELATLAKALEDSRTEGVAVVVEGESGVGKSRLVRRFDELLHLDSPGAVVLSGRCYERESVPYKAFDGVVDALARWLMRIPDSDARELLPTRPAPLVQIFPILRRVPAIAGAVRAPTTALDPLELRSRAFGALREMLVRIGDRHPLVVVIDDAQWSDDNDSLALLAEVTRSPDAPRMLLLATVRVGTSGNPDLHAPTPPFTRAMGSTPRGIELGPLSLDESRELASRLLERAGVERSLHARVETIAREARGHPLFIDVLARRSTRAADEGVGESRLEDALGAEVGALDADARATFEVVALCDAPLAQSTVARAAGVDPDAFAKAVQRLRVARLVITAGARGDDRIEPYHDRMRRVASATINEARRLQIHGAIARALEAESDTDPETLALHWREAGDAEKAARFSALAGDRAVQALAFDRAAMFYERALQLAQLPDEARRALTAKLGDALANGGRGKLAADALHQAAEGAPAAEALDLRRRAAEQLLRSGHVDDGAVALESVLRTVGVRLPSTPLAAIAYLLLLRAWLWLRGLGYRSRDPTQVSAEAIVRVDTCWSAAFGLALSDTIRATALQASNLLEALRLGEPFRVARALALEAAYNSHGGSRSWPRTEKLLERSAHEADRCGKAYARGWAALCAGTAHYLTGRYPAALECLDRGLGILREYARDVSWEIGAGEMFAVNVLGYLGRLRDLRERVSRCLPEMVSRSDLHGTTNLRVGWANLAWLVDDDVEAARRQIEEAMANSSHRGFHLTHFWELIARTNLSLYTGAPREAHELLGARWSALQRSMLPYRIQSLRVHSWDSRARAAIALAASGDPEREALLRAAERDARSMARERIPYAVARAATLRAGIAHMRGNSTRAATLLRAAVTAFDAADMALYANVARRTLGALTGGDEGRALSAAADAWFRQQTVKRPEAFVAMLAPGLMGERH